MTPTIVQSVVFSASAKELYDIYLDAKRHAACTGGKVKISTKAGGAVFRRLMESYHRRTLWTIPGQMIVQRWRSKSWKKSDPDSILVFDISSADKKGRIDLVHVNVPEQSDHAGVTNGWKKYYWTPLKAYLHRPRKPAPVM